MHKHFINKHFKHCWHFCSHVFCMTKISLKHQKQFSKKIWLIIFNWIFLSEISYGGSFCSLMTKILIFVYYTIIPNQGKPHDNYWNTNVLHLVEYKLTWPVLNQFHQSVYPVFWQMCSQSDIISFCVVWDLKCENVCGISTVQLSFHWVVMTSTR